MISIYFFVQWLEDGRLSSLSVSLNYFYFETAFCLMIALLIYYIKTYKKRYVIQTIAGIPCALFLIYYYFCCYMLSYENIYENISDVLDNYPMIVKMGGIRPDTPYWIVGVDFCLAGLLWAAVLAAFIVCIVNMARRRRFSFRQILCITIPIWLCQALHTGITLWIGRELNHRIGLPELILALMLTLTLWGKRSSSRVAAGEDSASMPATGK